MWFSRRAVGLHGLIIVIVPTFAALCVWQVRRALGGNELSWAYVFEWPFFAGYAIYMWWRFVHETPADAPAVAAPAPTPGPAPSPAVGPGSVDQGHGGTGAETDFDPEAEADEREGAERAAYNEYLAELAAQDKPKQWR